MGSDLYEVRVMSREKTQVELEVQVIHPDAMHLPADLGFALMMLREGASGTDPLGLEVDHEDTMDPKWLAVWARGFVDAVHVKMLRDMPLAAEGFYEHAYWSTPDAWMAARYTIEVTHPAWIAHLEPGMRFSSRAFSENVRYHHCAPISPDGPAAAREERAPSEPFVEVPSALLVRWELESAPEQARFPAYSDSNYRALEQVSPGSFTGRAALQMWSRGMPVVFEDRRGERGCGCLVGVNETYLTTLYYAQGSCGLRHLRRSDVAWIGRAGWRADARPGSRTGLAQITRITPPTVTPWRPVGDTLHLAVRCYSPRYHPRIAHAGEALAVLGMPLEGPGSSVLGSSPMARMMRAGLEKTGRPFVQEVYAEVAQGVVRSYEVHAPENPVWPDLSAMTESDASSRFDALGWPEWSITLRVFEPAFLEHFPTAPFAWQMTHVQEPPAWDGPPLRP